MNNKTACLCALLLSIPVTNQAQTPLNVTLGYAWACSDVTASIGLKADAKFPGRLETPVAGALRASQAVTGMTYTFYARRYPGIEKMIQSGPKPDVAFMPELPGQHYFRVHVKHTAGRLAGEVPSRKDPIEGSASVECLVNKGRVNVVVTVAPPSGQTSAPPPTQAQWLKVSATLQGGALPNTTKIFGFSVHNTSAGSSAPPVGITIPTSGSTASWTPIDPPQPATPGTYNIRVAVDVFRPDHNGQNVTVQDGFTDVTYVATAPPGAN